MANEGNLKPFQKGHDPRRNIKGRIPPTETQMFKHLLLKYLNKKVKVGDKMITMADIIAERVINDAAKGKLSALKLIMDRIEGKVSTQRQMGILADPGPREWTPEELADYNRLVNLFPTEEELKEMQSKDSTKP